jgi:hypothetical protein
MTKGKLPLSFITGCVQNSDALWGVWRMDAFEDAGEDASDFGLYERSTGQWGHASLDWAATRIVAPSKTRYEIYVTGPEGRVAVKTQVGKFDEEEIWPGRNGPEDLGDITDLRFIGKHLYATGMGRQVYRREGGRWTRADAGVVVTKPSTVRVNGFNSIDGVSEEEIYAVGFGGEMWWFDGRKWRSITSPTNLILNRVRASRDKVYVCGKRGLLLRGRREDWEVVEHGSTAELWDVELFDGKVYLASHDGVYRLTDDDALEPVKLTTKKTVTCGSLHANDGVLMSVGRKHVLWTEDGRRWNDITP